MVVKMPVLGLWGFCFSWTIFLLSLGLLWVAQCRRDMELPEASPGEGCEDDISYKEKLRELGLFRLEERRLRGELINACEQAGRVF